MTTLIRVLLFSLAIACAGVVRADLGGGAYSEPSDPDVAAAQKAIKDNDWNRAIELLTKAVARDDKNAGIYNMLGYSERQRGNLDAAFKHYERALALDPKHRGAHEYVGEAYLMAGNLEKAEEHLATLDKLCFFPCSEHRDLKAAIAEFKSKQAK